MIFSIKKYENVVVITVQAEKFSLEQCLLINKVIIKMIKSGTENIIINLNQNFILNNLFIEWNNLVSENVPVIYSFSQNYSFVKRDNVTINVEPSYYVDLTDKPWTIWIE